MYQAISTKYLGPTNSRGSRIKATAAAGSITIPYGYSTGSEGNHAEAAAKLARKMGWEGLWIAGGLPSETGNVYVCCDPHLKDSEVSGLGFGREGTDWFIVRLDEVQS